VISVASVASVVILIAADGRAKFIRNTNPQALVLLTETGQ
jgi:hypothetical protein